MCKSADGQHPGVMLLHPQGTPSKEIHTFEVGIGLLTAVSSSMEDGVESAYCMLRPYYITLRHAHG